MADKTSDEQLDKLAAAFLEKNDAYADAREKLKAAKEAGNGEAAASGKATAAFQATHKPKKDLLKAVFDNDGDKQPDRPMVQLSDENDKDGKFISKVEIDNNLTDLFSPEVKAAVHKAIFNDGENAVSIDRFNSTVGLSDVKTSLLPEGYAAVAMVGDDGKAYLINMHKIDKVNTVEKAVDALQNIMGPGNNGTKDARKKWAIIETKNPLGTFEETGDGFEVHVKAAKGKEETTYSAPKGQAQLGLVYSEKKGSKESIAYIPFAVRNKIEALKETTPVMAKNVQGYIQSKGWDVYEKPQPEDSISPPNTPRPGSKSKDNAR